MNVIRMGHCCFGLGISLALLSLTSGHAATIRWTNTVSGLWRNSANWLSNGLPDLTVNNTVLITNTATKTVTIDVVTPSTNLNITSLTLSAPTGATNTLALVDVTTNNPLTTSSAFNVDRGGVLAITNSAISAGFGQFNIHGGSAVLESGLMDCSGAPQVRVGRNANNHGRLNVQGGTFRAAKLQLGQDFAQGTLSVTNGLVTLSAFLTLGHAPGATGVVNVAGGELYVTNDITEVGYFGHGELNVSDGAANLAFLSVGNDAGASGVVSVTGGQLNVRARNADDSVRLGNAGSAVMNISGGSVNIMAEFILADNGGGSGIPGSAGVLLTGGQLFATNAITSIGKYGVGTMTVSNATVTCTNVSVGRHEGADGTLTVQTGGAFYGIDDLSIGRFPNGVGHVLLTGGLISLANDIIWVGREGIGDLTVSNGTARAKTMFVGMSPDLTNAPQGTVILAGGSVQLSSNLVVGTSLLSTGHVVVAAGNLTVTNTVQTASFTVASGSFTMNQGTVTADNVLVTTNTGQFTFNGGTLQAKAMTVANGAAFVVGDGVNPATLQLQGGTYSFANGLVISPNATVTGCGTVVGNVTNYGIYNSSCGPIYGKVQLQGFTGTGPRTVRFVASDSSQLALQTNDVSLTFAGSPKVADFILSVPTNTAYLSAKTAWNLCRRQGVTFLNGAATNNFTGVAGQLLGGDISGNNNLVNTADYAVLKGNWLKSTASADLTGDTNVNTSDYTILKGNWLKTGDPQ